MKLTNLRRFSRFAAAVLPLLSVAVASAQVSPSLFSEMRWRHIGPYRAGRTRAVAGVPSQPHTFYIGAVNGGVWKTDDAGQTWTSLWDKESSGSIGSIAVAPSNPNIIYVGSGEGLMRPDLSTGDGFYRSTDAGRTWQHTALYDAQQIPQIAVDPRDADRLYVAVLGHPYGPSEERGIFRSKDGGKTFDKVLYVDENTGGSDIQIDPNNPNVLWAGMWQAREGAWENGRWQGTKGGLYKSTDGGDHWEKITGRGLPEGITQVDIAIAPSDSKRMYLTVATGQRIGIFRSDDGGNRFVQATLDTRPASRIGGGDCPVPKVNPKNPDDLIIASTVTWRSTDAGKTWTGIRGAPGGDDYQNLWINPNNPDIIILTSDQGGIVTLNGGRTWSPWYNQPTAQMYHATVDNAFPYRVCGGQQDSGSACVASRGNDGQILTFLDWHPVGIEEYGYAAPDPLDPDIVYGGKVTRYNRRTGQTQNVEPKPLREYRVLRTMPLIFSKADPHVLFFGANTVWKTSNGGNNWTEISPDLTRKTFDVPESVGVYRDQPDAKATQRGVVYSLAPSPLDIKTLWAGTDDGLLWVTRDGAKWTDTTPKDFKPFWQVAAIDAGHFDANTAYVAVNTLRLDDFRPHLYRTHDGGKTWTAINSGIPEDAPTRVIREDPVRKGLLYAGTEKQVWVSFDDGDHWQSLRLNMGATSVRDLQVKDDDLVAATHGRGFLILDDLTPLRQLNTQTAATNFLYKPQTALRVRWDTNPPTPWPPETASGENPPDGAIFDYNLVDGISGAVTLEILDKAGNVVRKFSSGDPEETVNPNTYPDPTYWARPFQPLSNNPGHHRFVWDMHYTPAPGLRPQPEADSAVVHNTPVTKTSPWVMPGTYTVRLTAGGKQLTQTFEVKMDPRVKTSLADLQKQFELSKQLYDGVNKANASMAEISRTIDGLLPDDQTKALELVGSGGGFGPGAGGGGKPSLTGIRSQLDRLEHSIQNADTAPTQAQIEAAQGRLKVLADLMKQWDALKAKK